LSIKNNEVSKGLYFKRSNLEKTRIVGFNRSNVHSRILDEKKFNDKSKSSSLALALHIVGNPAIIYKYDVYTLLLHVYGGKTDKTMQVDNSVICLMIDSFMICVCITK